MHKGRIPLLVLVAAAFVACGRDRSKQAEVSSALDSAACSQTEIDWSSLTDAGKVCSGGFEYRKKCADFGGMTSCTHAHELGDYTESFTTGPVNCRCADALRVVSIFPFRTVCDVTICDHAKCDATNTDIVNAIVGRVAAARSGCRFEFSLVDKVPAWDPANLTTIKAPYAMTFAEDIRNDHGDTGNHRCTVTVRGAVLGHNTDQYAFIDKNTDGTHKSTYRTLADGGPPQCGTAYDAVCSPLQDGRLCATRDVNNNCQAKTYAEWDATAAASNLDGTPNVLVDTSFYCPTLPKLYTGQTTLAAFAGDSNIAVTQRINSRCLTGEDLAPAGMVPSNNDYWQTKWDGMSALASSVATLPTGSPPTAPIPDVKARLAQHRQLLFELQGNRLLDGQRLQAEQVYQDNPGLVPDYCGTMQAVPAAPCSAIPSGTVAMCSRIQGNLVRQLSGGGTSGHVPPQLVDLELSRCVDAAGQATQALDSQTCGTRAPLGLAYAGVSTELIRLAFAPLPEIDPATRQSKLRDRMQMTKRWYDYLNPYGTKPALEPDRAQRFRDAEIAADTIVQSVSANRTAALDGITDINNTPLRDQLIRESANDHLELLQVLLPSAGTAAPLTNTPALYVLADALQSHANRIQSVDYIHDFGCRFRGCSSAIETKVSQMYGLLGAIADPQALSAAPRTQQSFGWAEMFNRLSANHAAVVQSAAMDARAADAVAGATGYEPSVVLSSTDSDGPLYSLAAIVRPSKEKWVNYQTSGRFQPGDANALYTGLTSRKLDDTMIAVDGAKRALDDETAAYDTGWIGFINARLQVDTNSERTQNAIDEVGRKAEQLRQYAERVDGLRVAATVDREQFGDFTKKYDEMVTALEAHPGDYIVHRRSGVMNILPTQARYTQDFTFAHPWEVAVQWDGAAWTTTVKSGELVRIDAGGEWSPTCAVEMYATTPPPGLSTFFGKLLGEFKFKSMDGFVGAKTGPQGFGVTVSNSTFTSRTTTEKDFNIWDYAGGAGSAIGAAGGGTPGAAAGGFFGSVMGGLFGGNTQSYSSSGSETRRTAVFNSGLRVNTTPYTEYPAGALLVALVDDSNDHLLDIQVVQQPNTSIVVPKNDDGTDRYVRLYLIVNDAADPACTRVADIGFVTAQVTRLVPIAGYAAIVQPAMASAYAFVQKQVRDTILPQGEVLPSNLATIRSQALSELRVACGYCDLRSLDDTVMPFFNAWMDTELNQAERQVEVGRLQREVTILVMEAEALTHQIDALARQSQYLSMLPGWEANNIDQYTLGKRIRELIETVDRYLVPFTRAKYPEVISGAPGFTGLDPNDFKSITDSLDWTMDFGTLGNLLANAVYDLRYKVLAARLQFDLDAPQSTTIAVAIPKPQAWWDDSMIAKDVYAGLYRQMDPWDAEQVWTAITTGRVAEIHIPADLLYRASSDPAIAGQLSCATDMTPVIQYTGIFMADTGLPTNSAFNLLPSERVVTHASQDVLYGTARGPVSFAGTMPGWLNYSTPVYYGKEASAFTFYSGIGCTDPACPVTRPSTVMAGQGLSPFGEFVLDVDPAHLDRPEVYALILFMTVEYRNNTSGITPTWIEHCR